MDLFKILLAKIRLFYLRGQSIVSGNVKKINIFWLFSGVLEALQGNDRGRGEELKRKRIR